MCMCVYKGLRLMFNNEIFSVEKLIFRYPGIELGMFPLETFWCVVKAYSSGWTSIEGVSRSLRGGGGGGLVLT